MREEPKKTLTGIFDDPKEAHVALDALEQAGIPRERLGMVISQAAHEDLFEVEEGNKAAEGGAAGAGAGGPPACGRGLAPPPPPFFLLFRGLVSHPARLWRRRGRVAGRCTG